jgi:hypothetical protein
MPLQAQEQGLGKRFSIWFRRNEKVFWIAILVLVSVSFGATYIMSAVISDRGRITMCTIGGKSYSLRDIERFRRWFGEMARLSPSLSLRSLTANPFERDAQERDRDLYGGSIIPFLAALHEAQELGIDVPPRRIDAARRDAFDNGALSEKIEEKTRFMDDTQRTEFIRENEKAWRESIAWSPAAYEAWLHRIGFSVREFESALEMMLRVQALRDLYLSSDVTSRKDLYETFVRDRRKIKLALAVLEAEQFRDEVKRDYSDQELETYFKNHREDFVLPPRATFEYLKFPLSHFEATAAVAEDEIQKRYERDREQKYMANPALLPPTTVLPLTPKEHQEEAEAQKGAFKPLAEVRAAIETELRREAARRAASEFATELGQKLNPRPPSPSAAAPPPKAQTPAEIAAAYSFITRDTTPEFTKDNAKKILGDVYTEHAVNRWFEELTAGKELWRPPSYLTSIPREGDKALDEKTTYYFVVSVAGKGEQHLEWAIDPEKCRAIARDKLTLKAATDLARERAEALITKVRGGASLSKAIEGMPVAVQTTDAIGRDDRSKITLKGGEKIPSAVENRIMAGFFRDLPLSEKVIRPAIEDEGPTGIRFFVCTLDEVTLEPDPSEFTPEVEKQSRQRLGWMLRGERMRGWTNHLQNMVMKYATYSGRAGLPVGGAEE